MPYAAKLVHSLTITRTEQDDAEESRDEYGQPAESTTTATVRGLVQPKSAREMAASHGAGSEVADHLIFLESGVDIATSDAITYAGERYEVIGIRRFEYGRTPHLEVDARRVVPDPRVVDGGS